MSRYFCRKCQASCDRELVVCPACGEWDRFIPDVTLARHRSDHVSVMTSRQLAVRRPKRFPVWSLGDVSLRPPLTVAAYGEPGGGKSTWLARIAGELLRHEQKVLLVSAEEGFAETMSERLRRLEVRDDNVLVVGNVGYADVVGVAEERGVTVVLLDSWTASSWSAVDVDAIRADYIFMTTLQTTKDGHAAGPKSILHVADIVLHVDALKAKIEKSRWGGVMVTDILTEVLNAG